MKRVKVIKDLVHGYIEIDSRVENLINTLHFQRYVSMYKKRGHNQWLSL